MIHVLIVEDEEHLAEGLRFNLAAEGFSADVERDGQVALARLTSGDAKFDLVLLDVMLPGLDGFEVVRRLRESNVLVPVLMLTARGRTEDVLRGFEAGADDYVPKPFDLTILLARIQSLLRRHEWLRHGDESGLVESGEFSFGRNRLDLARQILLRDGAKRSLTLMEASLLRHLIRHQGRAVSRQTLLEEVWGVRGDTDTRAVDNFIARLRRYIEDEPTKPRHLVTVRGVGYRFVVDPDEPGT